MFLNLASNHLPDSKNQPSQQFKRKEGKKKKKIEVTWLIISSLSFKSSVLLCFRFTKNKTSRTMSSGLKREWQVNDVEHSPPWWRRCAILQQSLSPWSTCFRPDLEPIVVDKFKEKMGRREEITLIVPEPLRTPHRRPWQVQVFRQREGARSSLGCPCQHEMRSPLLFCCTYKK